MFAFKNSDSLTIQGLKVLYNIVEIVFLIAIWLACMMIVFHFSDDDN